MIVKMEPATATDKYGVEHVYLDGVELEFIGASSRSVWGNAEYVIKLEFTGRNMGQTGGEKLIWSLLLPEDRKYFAEFIEDGQVENAPRTLYTIQRRISGGVRCSEWAGPEYNKMHDLYTRYAITADFGLCQFFIVNGEPIAHDYGYLNDRSLVGQGYSSDDDSEERIYSRSSRNAEYATHSDTLGDTP